MDMPDERHDTMLARARDLVRALEDEDRHGADAVLDELTGRREASLFQELGRLTRELHETLNGFRLDARIASLAEEDIPDAKERLNHVIDLTEKAANRTLSAVEESIPLCEGLEREAGRLAGEWQRFTARHMTAQEFRGLSRALNDFLAATGRDATRVHGHLSEVLMAQDFQDLTGQILHRVIALVQDLEQHLVGLVAVSGQRVMPEADIPGMESPRREVHGPALPSEKEKGADVVHGQDEVDDLLSSLGF
jgi:chemotaxis protein CheZ